MKAVTVVGTGGSDNARGVARPTQKRSTSAFTTATVGVDAARRTESSALQLLYAAGGSFYPASTGSNSLSQEPFLAADLTGARAAFGLNATGAYSVLNSLYSPLEDLPVPEGDESAPPRPPGLSVPDLGPQPEGLMQFAGGGAGQYFSYELTERLALYQAADMQLFSSIIGDHVDPPIVTANASLGLGYAFARDTVSVDGEAGWEKTPDLRFDDELIPAGEGQLGRGTLGWSRQLARTWRMELRGGVWVARTSLDVPFARGPAWRARLTWRGRRWRVSGLGDHGPQSSVVLGGVYLTDRAMLRARGTFGSDDRYRFGAVVRAQRLFALGEPPETTGPATRWQVQVQLAMRPWPRRYFELGLSYRLTRQNGALVGKRNLKDLERNAVLLTATAGFPMFGYERDD